MAKILITGGAGFIGYHLAKALAEDGHDIVLCDNLFRGQREREVAELCQRQKVRLVQCDLTQPQSLTSLDNDYDFVYHLAAINGTRNFYEMPDKVLRVNTLALINVLDWFVQGSRGKFLFSSSSEVYAGTARALSLPIPTPEEVPLLVDDLFNPRLSYSGSKILGELLAINYARVHNFPFTIVRYHNIYGPRMGYDHVIPEFCQRIIRRVSPFPIYGAQESRAFCYVSDAVTATRLLMESSAADGNVVNIGNSGEARVIEELAKQMFDLFDFHPPVEIHEAPLGSVMRRCPDISKLEEFTGYRPGTPLSMGLFETFTWYKEAEGLT